MSLKIASFNVNSIKMRLPNVINWVEQSKIDIILMQETKTINENFPFKDFNEFLTFITLPYLCRETRLIM